MVFPTAGESETEAGAGIASGPRSRAFLDDKQGGFQSAAVKAGKSEPVDLGLRHLKFFAVYR